jgi:hypothetical protein
VEMACRRHVRLDRARVAEWTAIGPCDEHQLITSTQRSQRESERTCRRPQTIKALRRPVPAHDIRLDGSVGDKIPEALCIVLD